MNVASAILKSQVALELLWKLRDGTTRGTDLDGLEYFEPDLGTTVKSYVDQLVNHGYLVPITAARYLERQTATCLKEILRTRELKLSGKKADLVARILEEAPSVAARLAEESALHVPSEAAWIAVHEYRDSRKADRTTSHLAARDALTAANYQRAAEIAREFDSREYFQRYKAEPDPQGVARDADHARQTCEARPQILHFIPEAIAKEAAPVAAASQLFGCSVDQTLKLLPDLPPLPLNFEPLDVLLLYQRAGHHQSQLKRFRQDGIVTTVCIRSIGDHRDSDICRADNGGVYALDEVPELPHAYSDRPCGCTIASYFPGISTS